MTCSSGFVFAFAVKVERADASHVEMIQQVDGATTPSDGRRLPRTTAYIVGSQHGYVILANGGKCGDSFAILNFYAPHLHQPCNDQRGDVWENNRHSLPSEARPSSSSVWTDGAVHADACVQTLSVTCKLDFQAPPLAHWLGGQEGSGVCRVGWAECTEHRGSRIVGTQSQGDTKPGPGAIYLG